MRGVEDILSAFGLTAGIATTGAAAIADPTSANIQAVVNAYAENGQTPPAQLMAYLIQINEERHPEDTYRGAVFPWVLLGGAFVAFLLFRKGGRR